MSFKLLLSVAAGGAIGAVGRYLVVSGIGHWIGHGFPWGTFAVNLIGSFLLGALAETLALAWSPPEALRALLVVGLLGAFTTFSTFSLDAYYLLERGRLAAVAFYVGGSVVLCIAGFWVGLAVVRRVLA